MNVLRQIAAVTWMNLRNIPQRLGTSMVVVVGIAGVVGVAISVLAMAAGLSSTMGKAGREDRIVVLRAGAAMPLVSGLPRDQALTIMDGPGLKHDEEGKPIAAAAALVLISLPNKSGGEFNAPLLGVTANFYKVRPELKMTGGRKFQPAVREVIVGKGVQNHFAGMEIGKRIQFRDSDWLIVGTFEAGGDALESHIIADAETVLSAYRRPAYQEVVGMLESASAFDTFRDWITTNPSLSVDVKRESVFVADQNKGSNRILSMIGYVVGGIMAVGALFGALNTMYSAVSARALEIATLRAIGFGAGSVIVSVFAEALLLALTGGAIGAAIAWALFNGNGFSSSVSGGGLMAVESSLLVSPGLIAGGLVLAVALGLVGALFPAIRAARLPVATALQAR
jgi:putative ABC transport system permease protein